MTEALIADLARVRGLRVISRTSSMHYKGQKKSLPEIAEELGVDLLVEGSVARSGNRVRITAQLIDGASDEHIWARTYEDKVEDVLALQSRIATAIAGEVRGAVSSSAAIGHAARGRSGGLRPLPARPECLEHAHAGGIRAGAALLPAGDRQGSELRAGPCRPRRHLSGCRPVERDSRTDPRGRGRPPSARFASTTAWAKRIRLSPARCTARRRHPACRGRVPARHRAEPRLRDGASVVRHHARRGRAGPRGTGACRARRRARSAGGRDAPVAGAHELLRPALRPRGGGSATRPSSSHRSCPSPDSSWPAR